MRREVSLRVRLRFARGAALGATCLAVLAASGSGCSGRTGFGVVMCHGPDCDGRDSAGDVTAPADPVHLAATGVSASTIELAWVAGGGSTSGFRVAMATGPSPPLDCASPVGETGAGATGYRVEGLAADAMYAFRVCAVGPGGASPGATTSALTLAFGNRWSVRLNDEHLLLLTRRLTLPASGASLSLWFKFDAHAQCLLSLTQHDLGQYVYVWVQSASVSIRSGDTSAADDAVYAVPPVSIAQWHHLVVTRDGGRQRVFFDGVESVTGALPESLDLDLDELGRWYIEPQADKLNGSLDEVAVFAAPLSAAAVAALYNGGEPTDLLAAHDEYDPGSLRHWWRMGDGDEAATLPLIADVAATARRAPAALAFVAPAQAYREDVP